MSERCVGGGVIEEGAAGDTVKSVVVGGTDEEEF